MPTGQYAGHHGIARADRAGRAHRRQAGLPDAFAGYEQGAFLAQRDDDLRYAAGMDAARGLHHILQRRQRLAGPQFQFVPVGFDRRGQGFARRGQGVRERRAAGVEQRARAAPVQARQQADVGIGGQAAREAAAQRDACHVRHCVDAFAHGVEVGRRCRDSGQVDVGGLSVGLVADLDIGAVGAGHAAKAVGHALAREQRFEQVGIGVAQQAGGGHGHLPVGQAGGHVDALAAGLVRDAAAEVDAAAFEPVQADRHVDGRIQGDGDDARGHAAAISLPVR